MMNKLSTLTVAIALLGAAFTGCAVPSVEAPYGDVPLMTVAAHGVQIYECRVAPASTPDAAPAWAFVAPEADLFDAKGRRIGHHGAGPTWQHEDGSGFVGSVSSRVESPLRRAIPWLLLIARPQGASGAFAKVSSVQRINTAGGQPPTDGCGTTTLGARVHMAYRADYVLHVHAPLIDARAMPHWKAT